MATAKQTRQYPYDVDLVAKATGLVAADTAHTIITVGEAVWKGALVVNVTAIEAETDEVYRICVQGSTSSTFASDVQNLAILSLGITAANPGGAITSLVGRYELLFINEQAGVCYPYIRAYTDVTGTIATGINWSGFFSRDTLGHG